MADASDSTSSGRRMIKRQAPKDDAEQQDETRRKRGRQADPPQQSSNRSSLLQPSTLPENIIDLTGSDDEEEDVFMDSAPEESPMRDLSEVVAPAASGPYDACFGLVRRPP
jgi:hypothetical protein